MIFTLINANIGNKQLDEKLPEMIYLLESKGIDLQQISLRHIQSKEACINIHNIIESSELVIYVTPVDCQDSRARLKELMDSYTKKHPAIFVVLDALSLLSVEDVTEFIDEFEAFAADHEAQIMNVKYFKDALRIFEDMTVE